MLRHYRRGGLVRHLTERRYVWTGISRTRAVREFELLLELESEGLPAPRPYACAVRRHGLFWSGSLVTVWLPGRTLAERLGDGSAVPWTAVGRCIALFHASGVRHADLNAHNVMIDGETVHLIDFDRASRRRSGEVGVRWQAENLRRLQRSLVKLAARAGRTFDADGFTRLEGGWRDELARRAARST